LNITQYHVTLTTSDLQQVVSANIEPPAMVKVRGGSGGFSLPALTWASLLQIEPNLAKTCHAK